MEPTRTNQTSPPASYRDAFGDLWLIRGRDAAGGMYAPASDDGWYPAGVLATEALLHRAGARPTDRDDDSLRDARLAEQRHQLDPADCAFAALAVAGMAVAR